MVSRAVRRRSEFVRRKIERDHEVSATSCLENGRGIWKLRAMRGGCAYALQPRNVSSRNVTVRAHLTRPEMQLISVVFPEPLGPISQNARRRISTLTLSSRVKPPKVLSALISQQGWLGSRSISLPRCALPRNPPDQADDASGAPPRNHQHQAEHQHVDFRRDVTVSNCCVVPSRSRPTTGPPNARCRRSAHRQHRDE